MIRIKANSPKIICFLAVTLFGLTSLNAQNFEWAKAFEGFAVGSATSSIAIDHHKNILITGEFSGTVDFDPGIGIYNLTPTTGMDIYVVKLDSNGNFLWAFSIETESYNTEFSRISVDNNDNIILTGAFYDNKTVDFDPGPGIFNMTSIGANDVFIAKYDKNGNFIWINHFGGPSYDFPSTIIVDENNNIYARMNSKSDDIYWIQNNISIGNGSTNYHHLDNTWFSKMDSMGNFIWVNVISGGSYGAQAEYFRSMEIDSYGNIYLAGIYRDTFDIDPGPGVYILDPTNSNTHSSTDVYLAKYNNQGNFINVITIGDTSSKVSWPKIANDPFGNVILSGTFSETVDFDPGLGSYFMTSGHNGVGIPSTALPTFVLKLDSNLNFKWAVKLDTNAFSRSMDINEKGEVYILGSIRGITDLDPDTGVFNLSPSVHGQMYILMLDSLGKFKWAGGFGRGGTFTVPSTIVSDKFGNLFAIGLNRNIADYDPGSAVYSLGSGPFYFYNFILKLSYCPAISIPPQVPILSNAFNDTICLGNSATLYVSAGNLNDASYWTWYEDGCGQTLLGTGDSITISPSSNKSYYARGESGCISSPPCNTLGLNLFVLPSPNINLGADTIVCDEETVILDAGSGFSTYLWTDGSQNQTILIDSSINSLYGDNIDVLVTNSIGCESSDTINLSFIICTGIEGPNKELIRSIFPNPTNGKLTVGLNSPVNAKVKVYDLKGNLVRSKDVKENDFNIDLMGLPSARYELQILGSDLNIHVGIIKK